MDDRLDFAENSPYIGMHIPQPARRSWSFAGSTSRPGSLNPGQLVSKSKVCRNIVARPIRNKSLSKMHQTIDGANQASCSREASCDMLPRMVAQNGNSSCTGF